MKTVKIGTHIISKQLDLSGLGALEQKEWEARMKTCKDAIEFTRRLLQELTKILE